MTVRSEPEGRMSYRDYYGGYSRGYRRADDQIGAYSDWDRSGGGCCCGGGGYGGETSLFSDGTLFALLAGAALAFYVLYTTLTAAAASKRRRRSFPGVHLDDEEEHPLLQHFGEILGAGRSHGSLSNSNSFMALDAILWSELFVCWWCCVSFMYGKD